VDKPLGEQSMHADSASKRITSLFTFRENGLHLYHGPGPHLRPPRRPRVKEQADSRGMKYYGSLQMDRMTVGRASRMLNFVDDYSRESPGIDVARKVPNGNVLDLFPLRGVPGARILLAVTKAAGSRKGSPVGPGPSACKGNPVSRVHPEKRLRPGCPSP
jgi:hypothetical protein